MNSLFPEPKKCSSNTSKPQMDTDGHRLGEGFFHSRRAGGHHCLVTALGAGKCVALPSESVFICVDLWFLYPRFRAKA